MHADPSVMEQHSPCQHLPQPEQTVAEQLQQGAGVCSVLSATGWRTLVKVLQVTGYETVQYRCLYMTCISDKVYYLAVGFLF